MKTCGVLLIYCFLLYSSLSFSQISLTGSGAYTQDFDSLATLGTSSDMPAGWHFFEEGLSANTEYTAGNGTSNTGDTYSFGTNSNSERALGSIRTGSLIPTFGANFVNNTGGELTLLYLVYTGEFWRAGYTNRNAADRLDFQYSLDATSLSDGNWTDVDELDFHSPIINTLSGALNGNLSENRTEIAYAITGLSIADGAQFWIRWTDFDISSFDDGLAIDDFQIDISAPAVIFSMNPSFLNFGNVSTDSSATLQVTVENTGTLDNLEISNAVSTNPVFTFLPSTFPIVIPPGNTQVFDITFTPVIASEENGTIDFTHNAPNSPTALNLTGIGQSALQSGQLKFSSSVRDLTGGSVDNPDTVVLAGYSGQSLKALQFKILVGKTNGKLILKSVSRGAAIPADQFSFNYEISEGDFLPDGTKIDTINVVILGNGSNGIEPDPGEQEILIFSYDIINISDEIDQTFNGLSEVTGATSSPVIDANLSIGPDEIINIYNGTLLGLLGDVNLDNQVNILDILLMIDYILGRTALTPDQFEKADIAPWADGNPIPSPDNVVNVLDLAVLQNIVLTGIYPSGNSVNKPYLLTGNLVRNTSSKLTPGMNAKVTFYLTTEGITIGLESIKKVKGLQIEMNLFNSIIPQNTQISSFFDEAYYHQENDFLRIISYDGKSNPAEPGEFIIANIPFTLLEPTEITIDNIIVADEFNAAMEKIEIEMVYENPTLIFDYNLYQNFPNPFNPSTQVRFSVPKDEFVVIKIFDMLGQEVKTLFSENARAGTYIVNWDGSDLNGRQVSSGSYIYRMTAGDFTQSKKMIYIK